MIKHVTTVFQKFADFKGRASRAEYWWFYLFNIIGSVFFTLLASVIGEVAGILNIIWSLALIIPGIAVGVRRMHDTGKSGWFLLIPIYNLILTLTEGEKSDNEYGPDPYGDQDTTFDFEKQNRA